MVVARPLEPLPWRLEAGSLEEMKERPEVAG